MYMYVFVWTYICTQYALHTYVPPRPNSHTDCGHCSTSFAHPVHTRVTSLPEVTSRETILWMLCRIDTSLLDYRHLSLLYTNLSTPLVCFLDSFFSNLAFLDSGWQPLYKDPQWKRQGKVTYIFIVQYLCAMSIRHRYTYQYTYM